MLRLQYCNDSVVDSGTVAFTNNLTKHIKQNLNQGLQAFDFMDINISYINVIFYRAWNERPFFTKDLLVIFQHDKFYGVPKNLSVALRKFGLESVDRTNDIEKMRHGLVVHIMDQRGETEAFLEEVFIYPEMVIKFLKEHGLPAPAALRPHDAAKDKGIDFTDPAQYEQLFDKICRNCGTVTDPLGNAYRTPMGRLIFKTYLRARQELGLRTTGKYVFEHIQDLDKDKIIHAIEEDAVLWKLDEERKKIISVDTIGKYVMKFERELENLLGRDALKPKK